MYSVGLYWLKDPKEGKEKEKLGAVPMSSLLSCSCTAASFTEIRYPAIRRG